MLTQVGISFCPLNYCLGNLGELATAPNAGHLEFLRTPRHSSWGDKFFRRQWEGNQDGADDRVSTALSLRTASRMLVNVGTASSTFCVSALLGLQKLLFLIGLQRFQWRSGWCCRWSPFGVPARLWFSSTAAPAVDGGLFKGRGGTPTARKRRAATSDKRLHSWSAAW